MNYFDRPEVSNSDLSALKAYLESADRNWIGMEHIFYFGNLLDAMLTEPERINFYLKTFDGVPVQTKDFEKAKRMKASFLKDSFSRTVAENSEKQTVLIDDVCLEHNGMPFSLRMRGKLDFYLPYQNLIADLKTTAAKTQREFETAMDFFDNDRQAVVYMTLAKVDRFAFLGISKKNHNLFKIFIDKDSDMYRTGYEKFTELAFKWWALFGSEIA